VRAVVQRVARARVLVDAQPLGEIGQGLAILLGVGPDDDEAMARAMVDRIVGMRIFEDEQGKTNLAATDVGAQVLVVSQFTLYADLSRGRRPGFSRAAPPAVAEPLVERFAELVAERGLRVASGRFGAHMAVELVNDGPVTIVLSTDRWG
jgi:D-tyrosyl-tRNA(Tyr) deacylase